MRVLGSIFVIGLGLSLVSCNESQVSSQMSSKGNTGKSVGSESLQNACQINAFSETMIPKNGEVLSATWVESGESVKLTSGQMSGPVPSHCHIFGTLEKRKGVGDETYSIHFEMRLPEDWNGRFLFEGGGGTNGALSGALGVVQSGTPSALSRGFVILSQDSGHDNKVNFNGANGGALAFGLDPQARQNFAGESLIKSYEAAQSIMTTFYKRPAERNYFLGCSKGGQEGLYFASRHPKAFDGIVATAPGMSLPKAALAQIHDIQVLGALLESRSQQPTMKGIATSILPHEFKLIQEAIVQACDGDDGLTDGIIANFPTCTTAKLEYVLVDKFCKQNEKQSTCLRADSFAAVAKLQHGFIVKGSKFGYKSFPWDVGIGEPGWNIWKLGEPDRVPALNVILGGPALALAFTTPPSSVPMIPNEALKWELNTDLQEIGPKIFASTSEFPVSGWEMMVSRDVELKDYALAGGKLIVPHGVSDPVFSINDTITWWEELNEVHSGHASDFARVFPVPGMNHCSGGNATDQFDALNVIVSWVEENDAPNEIIALAGAQTPWAGRERPLCVWPKNLVYKSGSIEVASSFKCE